LLSKRKLLRVHPGVNPDEVSRLRLILALFGQIVWSSSLVACGVFVGEVFFLTQHDLCQHTAVTIFLYQYQPKSKRLPKPVKSWKLHLAKLCEVVDDVTRRLLRRIGQICAGPGMYPYPLRVPIIKLRDNNNERVVVVLYFTPFARKPASTTHLPPGRHLSLAWVEMHNLAEGRLYWYCSGARPADDVTACPERY